MTNAERKKRFLNRFLIALAAIGLCGGVYVWFFGFATMMVLETRRVGKRDPVVYAVPTPLLDNSISTSPGKRFTVGTYEFEVPWADLNPIERKLPPNWLVLTSPDGLGMTVMAGQPRELVESMKSQSNGARIEDVYDPDVFQSDYSLARYMLETTPGTVRLTGERREIVARSMMLIIKSITLPEPASSGIFSFETREFYGFQYGDPTKAPKKIVANLYSADGKVEFIFAKKNAPVEMRQSEINRVLQSLHKKGIKQ